MSKTRMCGGRTVTRRACTNPVAAGKVWCGKCLGPANGSGSADRLSALGDDTLVVDQQDEPLFDRGPVKAAAQLMMWAGPAAAAGRSDVRLVVDDDFEACLEFSVDGRTFRAHVTSADDQPASALTSFDFDAGVTAVHGIGMPDRFDSDEGFAGWLDEIDSSATATWGWEGLDGDWGDASGIAVGFDFPTEDPARLIAYYMRGQMSMGSDGFDGDQPGVAINPGPDGRARVWLFTMDMTKSGRDNVGMAMDGFRDHLAVGSPVRTTDRSGPGTKGTRAVPGVGQVARIALR
jgi:hypothetical protein